MRTKKKNNQFKIAFAVMYDITKRPIKASPTNKIEIFPSIIIIIILLLTVSQDFVVFYSVSTTRQILSHYYSEDACTFVHS